MSTMHRISTVSAKARLAFRSVAATAALLLTAAAMWSQSAAVAEPAPVALHCAPWAAVGVVALGDSSVPSATSMFAGWQSATASVDEAVATF